MQRIMSVSLFTLAALLSFSVLAANHNQEGLTCSGKQRALQAQIEFAKQANNSHQVQGLQKALDKVNRYCSNHDLERKYQANVQHKLQDVQRKQADLQHAQLTGDTKKIAKQQAKLTHEQQQLKQAQDQLATFYTALKAEQ